MFSLGGSFTLPHFAVQPMSHIPAKHRRIHNPSPPRNQPMGNPTKLCSPSMIHARILHSRLSNILTSSPTRKPPCNFIHFILTPLRPAYLSEQDFPFLPDLPRIVCTYPDLHKSGSIDCKSAACRWGSNSGVLTRF